MLLVLARPDLYFQQAELGTPGNHHFGKEEGPQEDLDMLSEVTNFAVHIISLLCIIHMAPYKATLFKANLPKVDDYCHILDPSCCSTLALSVGSVTFSELTALGYSLDTTHRNSAWSSLPYWYWEPMLIN